MMEGPSADSGEKREPVGDIDIAVVDSLKVLDPDGRLEKRTLSVPYDAVAQRPSEPLPAMV